MCEIGGERKREMVMEDNESSCNSSRAATAAETTSTASATAAQNSRQQRQKLEVYNEVLRRLKELNNPESINPCFDDELWAHFHRLPARFVQLLFFFVLFSAFFRDFFLNFEEFL